MNKVYKIPVRETNDFVITVIADSKKMLCDGCNHTLLVWKTNTIGQTS